MKAGKLGILSVVLVLGLSACNLINGGGTEPTDPTSPTDPTDPTDPGTGGNTGGTGGGNLPEGGFGVSTSATGEFVYSGGDGGNITSDSDPRVIKVSAGDTFYAQVTATADTPIEAIDIFLANSAPEGIRGNLSADTARAGFTLAGDPTGNCALGTSNMVTCTYAINVAAGTEAIDDLPGSGNEFAYVFRPILTINGEEVAPTTYRGYVDIE